MDVFPTDLPGLTWSVMKAPKFTTRVQTSISGRELRVPDQVYPIWTWTLQYSFLRDQRDTRFGNALGTGYDELRELMGFYTRQQGSFNTFLYQDPTDDYVVNQGIGSGDGVITNYQLVRTMGGGAAGAEFTEPITQVQSIIGGGPMVNGVVVPYSYIGNGVVVLASAPPPGSLVSCTFSHWWPVRFVDDTSEFENFMYQLWSAKQIKFQSVLLP